eukprot:6210376-Pleurochrysis_carterae.AAC.1
MASPHSPRRLPLVWAAGAAVCCCFFPCCRQNTISGLRDVTNSRVPAPSVEASRQPHNNSQQNDKEGFARTQCTLHDRARQPGCTIAVCYAGPDKKADHERTYLTRHCRFDRDTPNVGSLVVRCDALRSQSLHCGFERSVEPSLWPVVLVASGDALAFNATLSCSHNSASPAQVSVIRRNNCGTGTRASLSSGQDCSSKEETSTQIRSRTIIIITVIVARHCTRRPWPTATQATSLRGKRGRPVRACALPRSPE